MTPRHYGLKAPFSRPTRLKAPFSQLPAGNRAPLVAVAHGSRDPRSAATMARLVDAVRWLRPGLDVRLAFLDLSAPRLDDVLAGLAEPAVVVPLLLGEAYHARVDVPAAVRAARLRAPGRGLLVGSVLGPDPRLAGAALRRLAEAGVALDDPDLGVVLAAAGSSHHDANAAVAEVAAHWAGAAPWAGAGAAFAAGTGPSMAAAVSRLRRAGAARIAVASWFLAPGRLSDRIAAAAAEHDAVVAEPLGADVDVAQVVLDRYDAEARRVPELTARTS